MVELAAEKGVTLSADQVREFLKQMDERKNLTTSSWTQLPLLLLLAGNMRNARVVDP